MTYRTDHSEDIERLRSIDPGSTLVRLACRAAAELLQCHDETGISLDQWGPVRAFVEHLILHPITENGCWWST